MTADTPPTPDGLSPEQQAALLEHIQQEEGASAEAALESAESFEAWIAGHPALRQMIPLERISDIVPGLLNFVRAMLGFEVAESPRLDAEPVDEGPAGEIGDGDGG